MSFRYFKLSAINKLKVYANIELCICQKWCGVGGCSVHSAIMYVAKTATIIELAVTLVGCFMVVSRVQLVCLCMLI